MTTIADVPGRPVAAAAPLPPARPSQLSRQRVRSAWVFLAPMLIVLALVAGWPLVRTIWLSLTDATLNTMGSASYVGSDNYLYYGPDPQNYDPETGEYYIFDQASNRYFVFNPTAGTLVDETDRDNLIAYELDPDSGEFRNLATGEADPALADTMLAWHGVLADRLWWTSVWNTVWFAAISVTLETILGLLIALALNVHFAGRGILRAAVLIPWAIPTVISAKMWGWMYHDSYGVVNEILLGLGVISERIAWTADPDLAMAAVIFVDVWKTTPFMALLILAALQMLPTECYEAAKIDDVHPLKVFFRVTLPLIQPALLVAVIFRLLDALRLFDLVFVLTSNSEETMTMAVYARQQLVDFQYVGIGSAASTVLFAVVAAVTALYLVAGRVRFSKD